MAIFLRRTRPYVAAIATFAFTLSITQAVLLTPWMIGRILPSALTSSDTFGVISVACCVLIAFGAPLVVSGSVLFDAIGALEHRRLRQLTASLCIVAVVPVAYLMGRHFSDEIAIAIIGPKIQAGVRAVNGGRAIAPVSYGEPFEWVSADVSGYAMGGFMDGPEWIVYDAHPASNDDAETEKLHRLFVKGCSTANARAMGENYYYFSAGC